MTSLLVVAIIVFSTVKTRRFSSDAWSKITKLGGLAADRRGSCRQPLIGAIVQLEVMHFVTRDVAALTREVRVTHVSSAEERLKGIRGPHEGMPPTDVAAVQHHLPVLEALCVRQANLRQFACLALPSPLIHNSTGGQSIHT